MPQPPRSMVRGPGPDAKSTSPGETRQADRRQQLAASADIRRWTSAPCRNGRRCAPPGRARNAVGRAIDVDAIAGVWRMPPVRRESSGPTNTARVRRTRRGLGRPPRVLERVGDRRLGPEQQAALVGPVRPTVREAARAFLVEAWAPLVLLPMLGWTMRTLLDCQPMSGTARGGRIQRRAVRRSPATGSHRRGVEPIGAASRTTSTTGRRCRSSRAADERRRRGSPPPGSREAGEHAPRSHSVTAQAPASAAARRDRLPPERHATRPRPSPDRWRDRATGARRDPAEPRRHRRLEGEGRRDPVEPMTNWPTPNMPAASAAQSLGAADSSHRRRRRRASAATSRPARTRTADMPRREARGTNFIAPGLRHVGSTKASTIGLGAAAKAG